MKEAQRERARQKALLLAEVARFREITENIRRYREI